MSISVNSASIRRASSYIKKNHYKRVMMYNLIKDYIRGGKSIPEIIELQAINKSAEKSPLAKVYKSLLELLAQSSDVYFALRTIFPADEIIFVEAFPSAEIDKAFEKAARTAQLKAESEEATKSSLMIPIMSLVFGTTALWWMLYYQFPIYESLVSKEQMTGILALLPILYSIIVENLFVTVGIMVVIYFWAKYISLPSGKGGHRNLFDKLPPWSVQKELQAASFLSSLGTMMARGISFPLAVEKIKQSAPRYLATHLEQVIYNIEDNKSVSLSLDTKLFDLDTMSYIRDFSTLESFSVTLGSLGDEKLSGMKLKIQKISIAVGISFIIFVQLSVGYVSFSSMKINTLLRESYQNYK